MLPCIPTGKHRTFLLLSARLARSLEKTARSYGPWETALAAEKTVDPVKESFRTFTYRDPATGYTMPYNLYLPKGYEQGKSYPMVVFIADASANINDPQAVLYQGNGAVVWAFPEEQARHPAIVLAPQYTPKT